MRCPALLALLAVLSANPLFGQQMSVGSWKNYTDMKSVRGIVQAGTTVWAATGGGVFAFDPSAQKFTKYTNAEGLSSNDLSAITIDGAQRIWVGATDGSLNVFDPVQKLWTAIDDIRQSNYVNKAVQGLLSKGDTVFVVSDFGVSAFIGSRWEFGDTYANFGFVSSVTVTCATVSGDRIWVGTKSGLATALLTSPNLSAPTSWTAYTTLLDPSYPANSSVSVNALAVFHDTLMIGTDVGLAYFTQTTYGVISPFNGMSVSGFRIVHDTLFVLANAGSGYTIYRLAGVLTAPLTIAVNSSDQGTSFIPLPSVWVGTSSRGIALDSSSIWSYKYPNGPNSNFFSSLVVDDNYVVWCASSSTQDLGYYTLDLAAPEGSQWRNSGSGFYYNVSLGANGSVWLSSWGNGIVQVKGDSIVRKLDHFTVPSLPGARTDIPNYAVSGGAAVDADGNTWIANRNESNGHSLLELKVDSSFTFYDNQINPSDGLFHSLIIDRNGTKWLAGDLPTATSSRGVYFLNENPDGTLYGVPLYGGWGHLSSADGLQSNIILAFAIDLDGSLWMGTGLGVVILSDPQYPTLRTVSYPLREQFVQAIAVDALNNKWIGSKEGVFVVNPDGTQLLATYNVASTEGRLVDNDVRAIAIDQKRGIVYFGTEKGLSSLAIAAVQTSRSLSGLDIGPNPYILPNDQPLVIHNLVANSSVKILSVSGNVVTQFLAQGGGRAFWDGRDRDGRLVPSGVYFVVAYSETSSQVATGKVAVIRK
jgi:ligand-binding sensor domain-containing protein